PVSLGHVVGNGIELASRGSVPLGLKGLVGDTHLDVVRLAGEQQERLVWAFQPKRATGPSLPLLFAWPEIVWPARTIFGRPRILSDRFMGASLAWLARIPLSGICSIRPAPNTGVGILKITLRRASSCSKSGCASLQRGASVRPAMVNRSWTPPSGVPSGFLTNLASRTGPFSVMNDGTVLAAPFLLANAI